MNTSQTEATIDVVLPFETNGESYTVEKLGVIQENIVYNIFKRLLDIVISLIALVLLFLPMLVIALGVKLSSKGTVFYLQERLGLNGKKFRIIKFRTMEMNAEDNCIQWSTGDDDERIFKFGRILRKTRLDELPQFLCILKGEMSLVGPRPERECFYNLFETYIDGFDERLKVKPGLTGLAQIKGGYYLKPHEKIVYDIEYIKNRSLYMDLNIILRTVKVVLTHFGAK